MRLVVLFLIFFSVAVGFAQDDFLAKQYFKDGDFKKAVVFYEKLHKKSPRRTDYAEALVACYQQLEQYIKAEEFLLEKLKDPYVFPTFYIELGYNYTLNNQPEKASTYYQQAIAKIEDNPNFGYGIGYRFQKYALLDEAVTAYTKAMELKPELNYNFQLARIYGEQGNLEKMYQAYLNLVYQGKTSQANVLRSIRDFISEDPNNKNNILLRKTLLVNAQKNPNVLWNEMLSWLFIQQNQLKNAFAQEKAIYKRSAGGSMQRLNNLGEIAKEQKDYAIAKNIFEYIASNSLQKTSRLNAELELIDLDLSTANSKQYSSIEKQFLNLLETYGNQPNTLPLQIAYANFLAFRLNQASAAITSLENFLEQPLGRFGTAYVKMALGDILVFDEQFSKALIYFTQVQLSLKNDVLGQEARFKVAKASFYKTDFDWALTQLKVLRSSTSQLIANDAMQLSLLISDNILEDSTQTALKKYAKADFLLYQKKPKAAEALFTDILDNHKGEKIEDEALLKYAQLLEEQKRYDEARFLYIKIVEFFSDDILADDAHFALGQLFENHLNSPEKAKNYYEKIIYNYQDSYYFPQARKNFRRLRGDAIN